MIIIMVVKLFVLPIFINFANTCFSAVSSIHITTVHFMREYKRELQVNSVLRYMKAGSVICQMDYWLWFNFEATNNSCHAYCHYSTKEVFGLCQLHVPLNCLKVFVNGCHMWTFAELQKGRLLRSNTVDQLRRQF